MQFKNFGTSYLLDQGFVKEEVFCFRYPYFYFKHGESTSKASQQTSTASQLSKDLNKVPWFYVSLPIQIKP